jgi:hypothetical protein
MEVGKTPNGLELDRETIELSIVHRVFDNAPIVFNENQNFKDYRDNDNIEKYFIEKVVGVIIPDTVDFNGYDVTADVMLLEKFANRTHFDNWCIEYEKDDSYFKYRQCELFDTNEDNA